jgi:galactonate dehydratase
VRDDIRLCATGWEQLDDIPEDYARRAREISDAGFTAIKFDPFAHTLERAVEITCKIRETVGKDVDLIADANGRFTPDEGIRVAHSLKPFGLMWLEDLIGTDEFDSLEAVSRNAGVPLAIGGRMVGSRSFREVIERQLVNFVQADSHNVGGISRTRSIAWLAESYYMRFALHHSGGPVALAMNTQIAACAPNLVMVEMPYLPPTWWNKVMKVPFEQCNGFLRVPLGSGLGVEYCEELLNPA